MCSSAVVILSIISVAVSLRERFFKSDVAWSSENFLFPFAVSFCIGGDPSNKGKTAIRLDCQNERGTFR